MDALIFDFDGLILETETPDYQSWQDVFQEHGCTLPKATWLSCIGRSSADSPFDPYSLLEEQLGSPVNRAEIRTWRHTRFGELIAQQPVLPGVMDYITDARRLNMKLAVASSGTRRWVEGHLSRLGLLSAFDCIKCADDVPRAKPDPALYLAALDALGIPAEGAVALEDSPNGVMAAVQAGIFCVAVPNGMTRELNFDHADLHLNALSDLSLEELLRQVSTCRTNTKN